MIATDVSQVPFTGCFTTVNDMLNPIDDLHLHALQYVFLPRINRALTNFRGAWNNHNIRTEQSQTPNQLFTSGSLRMHLSGTMALDFFDEVSDDYGVEQDGIAPDNEDGVSVPLIHIELSEEQKALLKETIDPLEACDDYGISLYSRAVQLLMSFNVQC